MGQKLAALNNKTFFLIHHYSLLWWQYHNPILFKLFNVALVEQFIFAFKIGFSFSNDFLV